MKVSEDIVRNLRSRKGEAITRTERLMDEAADQIEALEAALSALPPDGEAAPVGYMRPEDVPTPNRSSFWVSFQQNGYYRTPVYLASPGNADRSEGVSDEQICRDRAMQQWEASLKRPDLSERDRVMGAIQAYGRQAFALNFSPPQTEEGDKRVVELEWEHGEARSSEGDLYSVHQLSEHVWQTRFNGTEICRWRGTAKEAQAEAELHRAALRNKP